MDPSADRRHLEPKPRASSIVDRATTGLPPDLLNRAASRLQILAWLYAFTFFMAAFFARLLLPDERRILFADAVNWAPGVISIAVAVLGGAGHPHVAVAACDGNGSRAGVRSGQQLWHCGGRVSPADWAVSRRSVLDRTVLGRGVDVAFQRRRADRAPLRRDCRARCPSPRFRRWCCSRSRCSRRCRGPLAWRSSSRSASPTFWS